MLMRQLTYKRDDYWTDRTKLARKEDKLVLFEPDHCGWVRIFVEWDKFEATIEASFLEQIGNFCFICKEQCKA